MAQSDPQARAASAKRTPTRNRIVLRNGAGKLVAFKAGDDTAEISMSKTRFARIADQPRALGRVLASYADTFEKARRTGRIAMVTLRISPDGEAEPLVGASPGDPLDAALAAARVRGQSKVTDILRSSDMLTARDFGTLIGASHETVNVKRRKGEILGLEGATRGFRYPRWQLTESGLPLPGLPDLFSVLGGQPWTVFRFLRTAHAELGGRTALDALKAGQVDAVLAAASNQATGAFA